MITRPFSQSRSYLFFLVCYCCVIYIISQYLRNFISVIAPDLRVEFLISPQSLAFLSLIFFLSFALSQLPLGMLIDRYGPRFSMLFFGIFAILGCLIFSQSVSYDSLLAGRILMGIGCSSFFMAPLVIYSRYFSSSQFSFWTALQLSVGNLGAWFATAPFGYFTSLYGWRPIFVVTAILLTIMMLLALFLLDDLQPKRVNLKGGIRDTRSIRSILADLASQLRGFKTVSKTDSFWPILLMHFCHYGPISVFFSLWAGPFLTDVHGFDLEQRSEALGYTSLALLVSFFCWNFIERFFRCRKPVTIFAVSTACLCILCLAIFPSLSSFTTLILLAIIYFCSGCAPCIIAHGRSMLPRPILGRGITSFNIATMSGVVFFQWLSGFVISLLDEPSSISVSLFAYRISFLSIVFFMLVCILVYSFYANEKPYGETA